MGSTGSPLAHTPLAQVNRSSPSAPGRSRDHCICVVRARATLSHQLKPWGHRILVLTLCLCFWGDIC